MSSRFFQKHFFSIRMSLQGALRPMHPPTMHPSAPGLLSTPSMAVQIPTAKVTLNCSLYCLFTASPSLPFVCANKFIHSVKWVVDSLTENSITDGCFHPVSTSVSIPELPPGSSSSRLPPPQSDRAEVLPTWKIAHSYPHHQLHPRPWRSIWATSAKPSHHSRWSQVFLYNIFWVSKCVHANVLIFFFLQNFKCQFVK